MAEDREKGVETRMDREEDAIERDTSRHAAAGGVPLALFWATLDPLDA